MDTLTKAEEKAMKILWSIESGLIRDVVNGYDEPLAGLYNRCYHIQNFRKEGICRSDVPSPIHFEYYPLIEEKDYSKKYMKSFVKRYFSDSFKSMVSAFGTDEELSTQDMEDLIEHFKDQIEKKKSE